MTKQPQPFEAVDLQLITDFLEDFNEDLISNTEMLKDLVRKLPEDDPMQKYFDIVVQYMSIAEGAIARAHLDLSDSNFMMFGDKDFKWEEK